MLVAVLNYELDRPSYRGVTATVGTGFAMSLATKSHLMTASHSGGNDEARSILGTPHSHEPTTHDSYTSRTPYDEVILNELPDVDDQCALEKGMTVDIKETKSQEFDVEPPALPERSALRTSRLLDSLKINSIESARRSLTTSHDTYLSSEEDASSIADDISDYDFDSGSESNADESEQSPAPRKSREASARAVSVIYVGKPCIVNLTHSRSSSSTSDLSESSSRAASTHERSPLAPTGFSNATRQDSSSTVASEKSKPAFLDTDPFANRHYAMDTAREQQQQQPQQQPQQPQQQEVGDVPRTPRTTAAVLQRFQKSLSLVRKRSRQNLRAGMSRDSFVGPLSASATNLLSIDTSSAAAAAVKLSEPQSAIATSTPQSPATYTDFMRSRRRSSLSSNQFLPNGNATPPPFSRTSTDPRMCSTTTTITASPPKKSLLGGLNINRRRSVKAKSVILS